MIARRHLQAKNNRVEMYGFALTRKPEAMPNPRDLDRPPVAIILAVIEVIMNEISKYVPITKAKNDLLDLIRQIESADESVAVTKNGVPAAVILSMEKYTGLLETLEILSDEDTVKSLRTSIRQARKGKWLRADEVYRR